MNELEINKAVAEKLGAVNVKPCSEGDKVFWEVRGQFFMRDYCEDWEDGGPIIEEYKISLYYSHELKKWGADTEERTEGINKNPLKAAMLCFLEMEI